MKFIYLTTLYASVIKDFYAKQTSRSSLGYSEQRAELERQGYGWTGAFGPALSGLGYEVLEISANVEEMQRAWAKENGLAWPIASWKKDIAFAQVRAADPEIIFVDNPVLFDRTWLDRVRMSCPHLRLILGFTGTSSSVLDTLRCYDGVLSCLRFQQEELKHQGMRAFYLRHAFNRKSLPSSLQRGPVVPEVCFVGGMVRANSYHLEREKFLEALVEKLPVSMYCPQYEISTGYDYLNTGARHILYTSMQVLRLLGCSDASRERLPFVGRSAGWKAWPMLQINPHLRRQMRPAVFGNEMLTTLRGAAIAFNKHIDFAGDEAGNMRLYEATGAGSCLLTDAKRNLSDFYVLDREVVAYESISECVEKAKWLLEHPQEREAIAIAGQQRTLRDHTFENRALDLHEIVQKCLAIRGGAATSLKSEFPWK